MAYGRLDQETHVGTIGCCDKKVKLVPLGHEEEDPVEGREEVDGAKENHTSHILLYILTHSGTG